jgi:LacI family transcriptional regulator
MKLQEIAKLSGVSPATVSRVFSHHPNIRDDVRDHVFAIAKAHNYHPRLSTKQRNVVIITPGEAVYPIRNCLEMVMMALTLELPRRGFRIEVLPQDNLDRLDSIQFCGAVAIGAEPDDFKKWPSRFSVPLVLVDRDAPANSQDVFSVRSDEAQGMELAIGHLHERGCRKIGCVIHGKPGTGNADVRRASVIKALKSRKLPAADALIHLAADDNYVEMIGKLLKLKIDALFCPGGNAGIVAAYALALFNKRVPDDISLIASEHTLFSRYATPPQTTITQDHEALAGLAADVIEARLDGRKFPQRSILKYSLIVRDSVASLDI